MQSSFSFHQIHYYHKHVLHFLIVYESSAPKIVFRLVAGLRALFTGNVPRIRTLQAVQGKNWAGYPTPFHKVHVWHKHCNTVNTFHYLLSQHLQTR